MLEYLVLNGFDAGFSAQLKNQCVFSDRLRFQVKIYVLMFLNKKSTKIKVHIPQFT